MLIQRRYGARAGRRTACATRLQAAVRGRRQLSKYSRALRACIRLQRAYRGVYHSRREVAAKTVQRATRMRHFRRVMCVVRLQRAFRAHLCRRLLKGLREVSRLRSLAG